jgi:hypothetical protein
VVSALLVLIEPVCPSALPSGSRIFTKFSQGSGGSNAGSTRAPVDFFEVRGLIAARDEDVYHKVHML